MATNEIMQALADLYNSLGTMKVGIENNNIFILANGLHRIRDLMTQISQAQTPDSSADANTNVAT